MTELSDSVRARLEGPNYAHVATLLPNGVATRTALEAFLQRMGDRIAFFTDPSSRKARNLEHHPRVAISITARDQPRCHAPGHVCGEPVHVPGAWVSVPDDPIAPPAAR
jgi:pyridoxine/pyridoxamine 5'-phosphate oxidase